MGFTKSKDRKTQRYSNILAKSYGIKLLHVPSKIVAVCNGGLVNGLTQEFLIEELSTFGIVQQVVLPCGKSTAFVVFENENSASDALNSEKSLVWPGGGPAFLAFVDKLPSLPESESLFSPPPGLLVLQDFITEEEEFEFLKCLNMDLDTSVLKNRVVKHFGHEFQYTDNRANTDDIEKIPEEFSVLWPRLLDQAGISFVPDQCTANRYHPGDGIPAHVDTHSAFTEFILSLSMQSDVVMDWRKDGEIRHVLLPRRSLCVMTEESRYGWTHCIAARKSDVVPAVNKGLTLLPRLERTSVTFRKTQNRDCKCSFPKLCDSALKRLKEKSQGVSEDNAAKFEETCVHQVYEEIGDHFSETRHKPWPNVVKFLNSFPSGSLILDVGCGNGKYLDSRTDVVLMGCDRSSVLCQICHERGFNVLSCDCLYIPVQDERMDGAISIAVLHHLSTKERRLKGIKEIVRVLRPGGRALIYVWAKNQEANAKKSSYLKQRKESKPADNAEPSLAEAEDVVLPVHTNRTNFQSSDMFVPWQKKPKSTENGPTFLRFYHVFDDEELREICEGIGNIKCLDYYYDQGNWCIILERLA